MGRRYVDVDLRFPVSPYACIGGEASHPMFRSLAMESDMKMGRTPRGPPSLCEDELGPREDSIMFDCLINSVLASVIRRSYIGCVPSLGRGFIIYLPSDHKELKMDVYVPESAIRLSPQEARHPWPSLDDQELFSSPQYHPRELAVAVCLPSRETPAAITA